MNPHMQSELSFEQTVSIQAPVSAVWTALTQPAIMERWLSETPVDIQSGWTVGSTITFRGNWHGRDYENKGIILQLEPQRLIEYTYWSSISELPDDPENYAVIAFEITSDGDQTLLTFECRDCATYAIFGHMRFYWAVTLILLKQLLESKTTAT